MTESEFSALRTTVEAMLGRLGAQENDTRRLHDDYTALDRDVAEIKALVTGMAADIKILERNSSTREQYMELSLGTKAIDSKVSAIDKAVAGLTETLNQSLREKSQNSSFWYVFDKFKEVIAIIAAGIGLYFMLRPGGHP